MRHSEDILAGSRSRAFDGMAGKVLFLAARRAVQNVTWRSSSKAMR